MDGPLVTFGDNNKGFIMGYGKIISRNIVIKDVALVVERKSWDDSYNDDEEVENYALMALEQGESFSSKTKVPTLTTINLNESQYKETVEKMSIEIFHIHTSMVEATEEVSRLSKANEKLEISGQYYEKNKPCANIASGLDYDALNSNRKVEGDKGKTTVSGDVPAMLINVGSPMFKLYEVNFSEEELIISKKLLMRTIKKCIEATPTSKAENKPMVDQTPKMPIKEIKIENAGKKKKKNGNIGINKTNNFAYIEDAPRK
ncbi:hypothetical protein AgCh_025545 [Apium graveolens]